MFSTGYNLNKDKSIWAAFPLSYSPSSYLTICCWWSMNERGGMQMTVPTPCDMATIAWLWAGSPRSCRVVIDHGSDCYSSSKCSSFGLSVRKFCHSSLKHMPENSILSRSPVLVEDMIHSLVSGPHVWVGLLRVHWPPGRARSCDMEMIGAAAAAPDLISLSKRITVVVYWGS